jgi:hypothetical protein
MGTNLNTVDDHIDAIKRWRDVYNSGPLEHCVAVLLPMGRRIGS